MYLGYMSLWTTTMLVLKMRNVHFCEIKIDQIAVLGRGRGNRLRGPNLKPKFFLKSHDNVWTSRLESFWMEDYAGQTPNSDHELAIYVL